MTDPHWVYRFGGGSAEGDARMKNLLGGKGANLAEMSSLGLPVPPGFTISTELCAAYYENDEKYPTELAAQVDAALVFVEEIADANRARPLPLCTQRGGPTRS